MKISMLCCLTLVFLSNCSIGEAHPGHAVTQEPLPTAQTFDSSTWQSVNRSGSPSFRIDTVMLKQRSLQGRCAVEVSYPQLTGVERNRELERVNEHLKSLFLKSSIDFLQPFDVQKCDEKIARNNGIVSFKETTHYFVTLQTGSILSLRYYSSAQQIQKAPAQPSFLYYNPIHSLTVDLDRGQFYQFSDLFQPGSNYQSVIHHLILQKLQAKYGISDADLQARDAAQTTQTDYSFYLTKDALVITNLFPQRARSAVQVKILPAEIRDIVNPDGPLSVLF